MNVVQFCSQILPLTRVCVKVTLLLLHVYGHAGHVYMANLSAPCPRLMVSTRIHMKILKKGSKIVMQNSEYLERVLLICELPVKYPSVFRELQ